MYRDIYGNQMSLIPVIEGVYLYTAVDDLIVRQRAVYYAKRN